MKKIIIFLVVCFYVNINAQCISPTIPVINSSTNTICSGQSLTLTITSGSLNSAINWQWYSGSCGSTSVGSGTQIVVSPVSSISYFARGEGSCVVPGSCANVSITVIQSPSVIATHTNPLCFGQSSGQISLFVLSGPGPFNYNWNNASVGPMLFGLSAGPYTATVTSSNGCSSYTTVNITQPNVLALNVSPTQTICYGNTASVYAQALGGTTPYTYTMTNLSNNTATILTTSGGIISSPTLTSTTQYTVSIADANGCVNGPQAIIVNVRPQLIAIGNSVMACDGDSVNLAANFISIGNGGPYSFSWSNMTNNQSINVVASLTNSPSTYTVFITDGCTIPSTSANFTVNAAICTGIKEQNTDHEISFYPNPVKNYLTIEQYGGITEIKIVSIDGKEILNKEISDSTTEINLSGLNNGMYYLSFYKKKQKATTEKIIVLH